MSVPQDWNALDWLSSVVVGYAAGLLVWGSYLILCYLYENDQEEV